MRRPLSRFLLLFLLFTGVGVRPAFAQLPTSTPPANEARKPTIQGEVRHRDGGRLERPVVVKLETVGGAQATQSWTGSTGRFEFYYVTPGQYTLVVDAAGYKVVRERVEYSFYPLEGIVLYLAPAADRDEFASGEFAVNIQDLKVPSDARKQFEKGLKKLEERKPSESVAFFQNAIHSYASFDDAYLQLTLAYFRMRSVTDAERTLLEAIRVNPQNWRALSVLGRVYRRQKQYEKSIEVTERSLAIKEDSWLAHVEMTEALAGLSRFQEAGPHAARAHQLHPGEPAIHQLYYNTLIRQDNYQAALAELDEFIKLFPEHRLAARARQQREALANAVAARP